MDPHKDAPGMVTRPARYRTLFWRICALTLIAWLVFYTVTVSKVKLTAKVHSRNTTKFLSTGADKFQSVFDLCRGPNINSTPAFDHHESHQRKTKIVLLWTGLYEHKGNWLPSTVDLQCPVTECSATTDRELLKNSSAVVFHWRSVDTRDLPLCSPSNGVHCPLLVLYNRESPVHTNREVLKIAEGRVLWTVTYRRSSDIYAPYGEIGIRKRRIFTKPEFDSNKRLVCWLVSHCHSPSRREVFVEELQKHIEVDVYGSCGNMSCPHASAEGCYRWLSDKYLFYLSLENAICRDYVTEKLYNALKYNMVPVVLGDKSNYRHLPPHSYINATDYASPKQLAEYIEKVGRNKTLYESYMSWKREYEVLDTSFKWFCDLCQKLHEGLNNKPRQNLVDWWYKQSECRSWLTIRRDNLMRAYFDPIRAHFEDWFV